MSMVVNLIGQRSQDVIGRLSISGDVIGCEDCNCEDCEGSDFVDQSG